MTMRKYVYEYSKVELLLNNRKRFFEKYHNYYSRQLADFCY